MNNKLIILKILHFEIPFFAVYQNDFSLSQLNVFLIFLVKICKFGYSFNGFNKSYM